MLMEQTLSDKMLHSSKQFAANLLYLREEVPYERFGTIFDAYCRYNPLLTPDTK